MLFDTRNKTTMETAWQRPLALWNWPQDYQVFRLWKKKNYENRRRPEVGIAAIMDRPSSPADGGERSLRLIKPYYELLNDLSKDVDEDYLQELCTLSQSLNIPDEKFECDTPLELFR